MGTYQIVNEHGLAEIRTFLNAHAKEPERLNTEAFALDVEKHVNDGNGAYFELSSHMSIHRYVQEFYVSDAGLDTRTIDE